MARLRRRWRTLKWLGLCPSILLLLTWSASLWFTYGHTARPEDSLCRQLYIQKGCLISEWNTWCDYANFTGWFAEYQSDPCRCSWTLPSWTPHKLVVPLWIPLLLTGLPTAVLWWRDRRRFPPHGCQGCGYDLTGNGSGVCPECGSRIWTGLGSRGRLLKRSGIGLCVFIILGWSLSLCALFGLAHNGKIFLQVVLHRGLLVARYVPTPPPPSWAPPGWALDFKVTSGMPRWQGRCEGSWAQGWLVFTPLWIPFLLVALPTGFLFYLDRRRIPSHCCQGCGYDLTGNTSGVCPECGERT